MTKIGFIDYYLDEWHANNYPKFFQQWTEGFEVAYAWGQIDKPGGADLSGRRGGNLALKSLAYLPVRQCRLQVDLQQHLTLLQPGSHTA